MPQPRQRGSGRSRAGTTLARQTRPLGQCLQTWKDCPDCPAASPLEDMHPLPAPRRTRSRPHSGETTGRLVFCSLNDVNCRDLAIGQRRASGDALGVPITHSRGRGMVGRGGVEPPTSRLSGVRSNHLSYRPGLSTRGAEPSAGRLNSRSPCSAQPRDPAASPSDRRGGACRAEGAPPKTRQASPPQRSGGGGAYRDRTGDLMLAKHALSQLS
jgi:hypothetical protein